MNYSTQISEIRTSTGEIIPCEQILRVEESFGNTFIIDINGKKHQSDYSIDVLEYKVPSGVFKRIHSKHLINEQFMVQTLNISTKYIQLANGEQLPIANAFMSETKLIKKGFINRIKRWIKPSISI